MHPRALELIHSLDLTPHPEGGHFRRIHASDASVQVHGQLRPAVTAIHFLLARGEHSHWHRVDANEWWHWQEGEALELLQFNPANERLHVTTLGASTLALTPMQVVPAGVWQAARPLGDYALVGCTVSPGFEWAGFELLDPRSDAAVRLRELGAPCL